MKRYTPTLEAFSWANSEDCDTEVMPVMAETRDGAYVKRDEAEAECERLRRELSEAREAVGERWFSGGVSLAQAIKRKVRFLEERLPEDPVLTCARCGPTPHRWRPSPEAGPHWRCSECGEITGPEGGAR